MLMDQALLCQVISVGIIVIIMLEYYRAYVHTVHTYVGYDIPVPEFWN